jgi:predicted secreted Zn-dependent protease
MKRSDWPCAIGLVLALGCGKGMAGAPQKRPPNLAPAGSKKAASEPNFAADPQGAGDKKADDKKADEGPKFRRYAEGPLTAADFQMELPNPLPSDAGLPLVALTYAELRFSFHYSWSEKANADKSKPEKTGSDSSGADRTKVVTAWPVDLTVFSSLDRKRSWNSQSASPRILDHEQGHFDIAEIQARKFQAKMDQAIAARKYLGKGKTEADAVAQLEQQFKKDFDQAIDELTRAQRNYDLVTRHGLDSAAQADMRKQQQAALAASAPKEKAKK